MKKNLFKLLFVMLFVLTVSFTFVYNNNTNVLADETETEEVVEPSLNIYKKNISYASEIYIMYAVSYEGIDVTTNPVKMLFYNSVQDEYTTTTASYVALSQGSVTIGGVSCQIFASKGLAAKQMTDDIYARAYVEIGEETIYSDVVKYSVLEYYYEIKEAGTVSTNILNLLEAMVNYGAAAQINFNYNTDKLANATYYKVSVENAVLSDGFTSGRFKAEEQVTLIAPEKEGYVFKNWTNANDDVVSTDVTYTLTVTKDETLTANYEEEAGVILTLSKEAAYDATPSTLNLPSTVTFDYNNETVTENVTWDTTSFVVNQIGKQKLYGTLSNDSYKVNELSIEIDVLPYTFSLNEETNEYSITKYYGTSEEETIPETFNNVSIVELKQYAFENVLTLKNLIIPTTINKIEQSAIYGCNSLESITIPFIGDCLDSYRTFGYIFGASSASNHSTYIPTSLKNLTILNSVTNSEYSAFKNCSSLTNVYYEGTIETWCNIDFTYHESNPMYYAENFYMKNEEGNWYEVTEISIPDTITEIGAYQFVGFDNLTSITIPEGVTNIEAFAFNNCNSLTNVYYEGTIESWCNMSFNNYSSNPMYYANYFYMENEEGNWDEVTEITIPNTITKIGNNQFSGFKNVKSIIISEGIMSIEKYAFGYCDNLTNIELSTTITSIGEGAFYRCRSLVSLEIPEGVKNIESYTFSDCNSLTSITIPNSVTSIGSHVFENCISLISITIPNSVTSIGSGTFSGCSVLENIELSNTITFFGTSVFYKCSSLTSIIIPNCVTRINSSDFSGCTSLTSITIPSSVTSIISSAFHGCTSLTNVYYEGSIEDWCNISFSSYFSNPMYYAEHFYMKNEEDNWHEVTEIIIPNTITEIGYCQFYGFENITSITIQESVTSIVDCAFSWCSSLTNITLPNSVTSVGLEAFSGCSSLTSIEIPNSVTSVGNSVFSWCSSLTNITLPNSVTSIVEGAFFNCSSLTNITLPNSVTSIGSYAFNGCSGLTSITIPNSVTSIGEGAFYNCSGLLSIEIPEGVTSIESSTFYGCRSLTSITLPNTVTTIESKAFYSCANLTYVYYVGTEEEWNTIIIESSNDFLINATIHYEYVKNE